MDRRILLILAAVALTACAAQPKERAEPSGDSKVVSNDATQSRDEAIYNVLVAELAGQRGDKDRAAEAYAKAARRASSAAVAERAARVATYAGRASLARQAAERWQALAPESSSPRRVQALLALRQGDSEAAYRHLKATLPAAEAELEEALAEVGALVAKESADATGVAAIAALAQDYPGQRMAHYIEAKVAMQAGQPEAAVEASARALEQSADWQGARLLRVRALLEAERTDKAINALRAMVDDNPENTGLRLQLARTLADSGRGRSALEQFEQVIEAEPEDAQALYAGALVALERGENAQAREWLERVLSTGQRKDGARYYLGRVAEAEENYAAARERYSQVGGDYEHQAQIRLVLILAAEGKVDEAVTRLQRVRENNPNLAVQTWQTQGQLLREAGRRDAAIDAYNQGLEASPGNIDLLYARAMTHVQLGAIDAAERDLREVLARDADNAHALNALGYTLLENTSRTDEAEELIRDAYAQLPQDPAVIDSMGWLAYKQGRLADAERYLREAHELSEQAEIAAHLGEVLWRRDKREAARRVWNEALANHPNQAEPVRDAMERLTP